VGLQSCDQIERLLDRLPVIAAPRLVLGNARRHFSVARFGRGDIDASALRCSEQFLRVAAFARARAAQYQGRAQHIR
jgi:hypothetical protein